MARTPDATRPVERKLRADAQQNRERILGTARLVFRQKGAGATLDDIVRRSGVGPGTLYRHFPSRDALIEAVYRHEVQKLVAAGERLTGTLPPLAALRAWMLLLVEHVVEKRLILPAMDTVPGGSQRLIEGARGQVHGTFLRLIQHAIQNQDLAASTEPDDLVRGLIGVFHTADLPGWEASACRIVDLLLRGARPA